MKKKIVSLLLLVSAALTLFILKPNTANAETTDSSSRPIFLIPGAFDTDESWDDMVKILDPNGEHSYIKLNTADNGKVLRQDVRIVNNDTRPIVQVSFPINSYREEVIARDADGLRDAISIYKQSNPFTNADIIGHSNGGTITTTYLEKNANKAGFGIHFDHFISAGTPYNFQAGNGAENTTFLNRLIAANGQLPKDLQVTNIIGSLPNSSLSDGVVSRDSALAGRQIFEGRVGSFQQLFLEPTEDAGHGNLSSSPQVAKILQQILDI